MKKTVQNSWFPKRWSIGCNCLTSIVFREPCSFPPGLLTIPEFRNVWHAIPWSTLSKAFAKSISERHFNGRTAASEPYHNVVRVLWGSFCMDGSHADCRSASNFFPCMQSVSLWRFAQSLCWYGKSDRPSWVCAEHTESSLFSWQPISFVMPSRRSRCGFIRS